MSSAFSSVGSLWYSILQTIWTQIRQSVSGFILFAAMKKVVLSGFEYMQHTL